MKILLINDIGRATGGAEIQMLFLRKGLRDRGHDVRLFSSRATSVADSKLLSDYSCFGTNSLLQVLSQTANPSALDQVVALSYGMKKELELGSQLLVVIVAIAIANPYCHASRSHFDWLC